MISELQKLAKIFRFYYGGPWEVISIENDYDSSVRTVLHRPSVQRTPGATQENKK